MMEKRELLYEGKAKKVYKTDQEDVLIVDYKDDATAFNGLKKGTITGKGVINNRMTNHVFQILEKEGVPTHFIEELSDRETAVKKVEIVPLEVIIRNIAAGPESCDPRGDRHDHAVCVQGERGSEKLFHAGQHRAGGFQDRVRPL